MSDPYKDLDFCWIQIWVFFGSDPDFDFSTINTDFHNE